MTFHENATLPLGSYGSAGGPGHLTLYLASKGGSPSRVARWDGAARQYDVRRGITDVPTCTELIEFYLAREGGLHGFRFKDWSDFSTDATWVGTPAYTDEIIGTGDGTTTQFQLVKRYTQGGSTRVRNILKPLAGTVVVGKAGSQQTLGTHFTVDTTTGTVTFASAPTLGQQITAGCEFDVPCMFGPGADALLTITHESLLAKSIPSVPVLEEVDPSIVVDEYPFGGAFALTFGIPTQITPLMGRLASLTPTAAADILIPAASLLPLGGPHFVLANVGSFTVTVKSGATSIGTIAAGATKHLSVFTISSANTWRLY